jgi:hypothetical protein
MAILLSEIRVMWEALFLLLCLTVCVLHLVNSFMVHGLSSNVYSHSGYQDIHYFYGTLKFIIRSIGM